VLDDPDTISEAVAAFAYSHRISVLNERILKSTDGMKRKTGSGVNYVENSFSKSRCVKFQDFPQKW